MYRDGFLLSLSIIIIVTLNVLLGVWWTVVQWQECRAFGLSVLYCIKHIL